MRWPWLSPPWDLVTNPETKKSQVKDVDPGTEITSLSQEDDIEASQTELVKMCLNKVDRGLTSEHGSQRQK